MSLYPTIALLVSLVPPPQGPECNPVPLPVRDLDSPAVWISRIGDRVELDGDFAAVSAPQDMGEGWMAGAVRIYERRAEAEAGWTEWGKLLPLVLGGSKRVFGWNISLSGTTLLIQDAGLAFIYDRVGDPWWSMTYMFPMDSYFGGGALDGDTVAFPAHRAGVWVLEVFERTSAGWPIQASVPVSPQISVATLELDADTIVARTYNGGAFIFERQGSTWSQVAYVQPDTTEGFFAEVAIEGDTIALGSPDEQKVYIYERTSGSWNREADVLGPPGFVRFGTSLDLDGDRMLVGAPVGGRGESLGGGAILFDRIQGDWFHRGQLTTPLLHPYPLFGDAVALDGDTAVVGAPQEDVSLSPISGAAFLFSLPCQTFDYCEARPNSSGAPATLEAIGSTYVAFDNMTLTARGLPDTEVALVLYGRGRGEWPFGDGTLCVSTAGSGRLAPRTAIHGSASWEIDYAGSPRIDLPHTWYFQVLFRDVAAGGARNTSNAIALRPAARVR